MRSASGCGANSQDPDHRSVSVILDGLLISFHREFVRAQQACHNISTPTFMHHRRARGRAALMALPLLLQTLLASLPVPAAVAARPAADPPGIIQTGKQLPSAAERADLKDGKHEEPEYIAPDPADEAGELRKDGSFRLPKDYKENPDAVTLPTSEPRSYGEEKRSGGKKGGVEILRLDVSGDVTTNTTWTAANSPYVVTGTINVQSPATLTIEPGVVVKFQPGANLLAQAGATLTAIGTSTNPIIFTSIKDDSAAGDTNEDGSATSPAAGDWNSLGFTGYTDISGGHAAFGSLQYAQVRYGQQVTSRFSKPALSDDRIEKMSLYGLYLDTPASGTYTIQKLTLLENYYNLYLYAVPSSTEIKDSVLRGSTGPAAVQAQTNTAAKLTSNAIDANGPTGLVYAVQASSSPMVLRYNSIAFNRRSSDGTMMGINASGSTVDAQYNWWGSTSGPEVDQQANTGGGSKIPASLVTYSNWLGSAYEVDHKRGNLPWAAKANLGVDVASGNLVYTDTDVSIPTIGFPLEIVRTYNNQTAAVAGGDFGAGWTWTYGTNLNVSADTYGGVVWERADGTKNYFKKNPDNTFTGEDGIYSSLVYDSTAQQYTLTHKDQTKFLFNSTGKLIKQIDTDGNETVIARDANGKIQTVTEPTGRQLTVTYSGSNISQIVDPLGRTFVYTFASSPLALYTVTRKVTSSGATYATETYGYVTYPWQLQTLTQANGDVIYMTFDSSKRVITQRLNDGYTGRFTYGPGTDQPTGLSFSAGSTGVADNRGRMHVYFYNPKSNKVSETWHEQGTNGSQYWWYAENLWSYVGYLQTSWRDIDQKTTTYKWDRVGNLLEEVKPGNRKTTYTYDAFNNRTSAKDNLNRTTTFQYDSEQHLTKVIDPLSRETTTTYTTAGLPATVTDARGKVTTFTYDAWGYPETVTNAESETLTFDYDAGGRKLWEETPQAKRTTYTYNSRDQVLTVTDPLSNVTTSTYDSKGRKETVTDADNHTTTFTYNTTRNVLWKVTDAAGGVVEYTYDNLGPSLTEVKDALGRSTIFTYELMFGRKATEKDPLNVTTGTWTYKPSGLLATAKDGLNQTTTYTYDTANDLTSIAYSDSKTVTQTFDGVGNRLTMTDWLGTHTWTYDALNRVTSYTDHASRTVSYTYDEAGNLSTITYPGNKTVTYTYDDANRIASVTDWDSRVTNYTYDASGRIGSFTLPNGITTTFGYDDASRTTSVDHMDGLTPVAQLDYTFDDLGNRLTKVDAAGTETYTYDALSRVTNVAYPGGASTGYTYDKHGNRLTKTDSSGTVSYTYDAADQLLTGAGVRSYDANGQLTKIGSKRTLTWDARQQLTQVSATATNTAPAANAGADKTGYVNRLVILDGKASSDPEGDALSYTWTEAGTNPATGILKGANSPEPGFTPTITGSYAFHLTVSDGVNTSTQDSVTITVQSGAPAAQTLAVRATGANSGHLYSYFPTSRTFNDSLYAGRAGNPAYDYMGAAQFTLPAQPGDTYLSGASLTLMGLSNYNPTVNDAWTVDMLPTSFDGTWPTSATWNSISGATPDRTLSPALTGSSAVSYMSADSWTFTTDDVTALATRYAGTGKASFRVKGNNASNSTYVTWFGGNASTATNRPTLNLTFSPSPQYDHLPLARAGIDQTVVANTQVTLNGATSYDYEGAVASYQWTANASNPATVTLSSSTAVSPTFTPTVAGTYRFSLVVTDGAAQSSTADEVVVTILRTAVPQLTKYTYNGDGDRVKQEKNSVVTEYVQDSNPKNARVLMETTGSTSTYYVYGHDLLYTIEGATPHFLHTDSLGSTVAVTDANGDIEQTFAYDIFGELRKASGSGGATYTFTGEENDHDGLVYLRARYYEPMTGRFTSRDPFPADAVDTQTFNRYVYVKNNPTNYVDPSGEVAFLAALAAPEGVAAAAAIGTALVAAAPYVKATGQAVTALLQRSINAHLSEQSGRNGARSSAAKQGSGPTNPGNNGPDPNRFSKYGRWLLSIPKLGHIFSNDKGHDFSALNMTRSALLDVVQSYVLSRAGSLQQGIVNHLPMSVNGVDLMVTVYRWGGDYSKFIEISNFWIR
jgi:RHS repeat-associated protein